MALIVLVVAWAAFLLPGVLRARAENRPSGSISDFRRQLRVLARTSPAYVPGRPMAMQMQVPVRRVQQPVTPRLVRSRAAVKRRRDVFVGLLVGMGASLVLGFLPPLRALWAVHVVVDVLFLAYLAMLIYARNLAAERDMKVRFLPSAAGRVPAVAEPALAYRRSAN